ncbi:MAG: hypothetical protein JSS62_00740 [Verrucomicrobia bacterium]|nr:hypothetical protein [Verrucomicrobiota bacterium]MBS0645961.1 hypothetical protein [Verrucomicrobiota bacterium]
MTLKDVAHIFHSALRGTLTKTSLLMVLGTLFVCGTIVVFFHSFMLFAEGWWGRVFGYFPFFFVLGLLLASEYLLVRLYVEEKAGLWGVLRRSWENMFKISLCALPFVIVFLTLWICSGFLLLLFKVPYLGNVLSIVLFFVPFVLHQTVLLLAVLGLYVAFVVCPMFALEQGCTLSRCFHRLKTFLFFDLLLILVACFPAWMTIKGLAVAYMLTVENASTGWLGQLTASFCMMLPCVVVLTPMCLFFVNVAVEAQLVFAQMDKTTLLESGRRH